MVQSDTHLAISTPASESDCDGIDSLHRFDDRESREDDEWTSSGSGRDANVLQGWEDTGWGTDGDGRD